MTIKNKSERNYRGKCLGWPVTSYGAVIDNFSSKKFVAKVKNRMVYFELKHREFYVFGDFNTGECITPRCSDQ